MNFIDVLLPDGSRNRRPATLEPIEGRTLLTPARFPVGARPVTLKGEQADFVRGAWVITKATT